MVNKYNSREIGDFIEQTFTDCKFVGLTSDGEVLMRFPEDGDIVNEAILKKMLREEFPDLSRITTVVEPSIPQVKEMVDQLNKLLEEGEGAGEQAGLLDIEEF